MREFIRFLLGLLAETFGGIRDQQRNAEVQQHVADARDRADDKIKDMSVADRDDVLAGLYRNGGGGSTGSGAVGDNVPDDEERTDPNPHTRVRKH